MAHFALLIFFYVSLHIIKQCGIFLIYLIVCLIAISNKNRIISRMFHKLQFSWIKFQNLTEDRILVFWIVSWGIIMNYVVGPSIQKWVHFTGSKAAILHISFLSLKSAKTFSSDITLSVLIHIFWSWTVKCINIICIFSQWPWIMFFSVEREKHCLN